MPAFARPILLLTLAAVAGCNRGADGKQPGRTTAGEKDTITDYEPELKQDWQQQNLSGLSAGPVTVKEGPAPLLYMVEDDADIRIVNLSTRQPVATIEARERQIIAINADKGITVAGESLVAGPLASGHRYAIQVIPPAGGGMRTGTQRTNLRQVEVERTPTTAPTPSNSNPPKERF